jgi:hypothetical protein
MRLSQKMMISPSKVELRRLSVSFKASSASSSESSSSSSPERQRSDSAAAAAANSDSTSDKEKDAPVSPPVPPRPTQATDGTSSSYQTLKTSSSLETAILKAAASNRRRLDSVVDEDTWVFPDRRSTAIAAPPPNAAALAKRASMISASNLPKISVKVNVPHLNRTFDCTIDPGQSIANFKLFMWVDVFQLQGVNLGGQLVDYLFRAEYDDFFLDEKILVKDTPYFKYCAELKMLPMVYYVNRSEVRAPKRTLCQNSIRIH